MKKTIYVFEMTVAEIPNTLLPPGIVLPPLEQIPDADKIEKNRTLIGKLLYASQCVGLDLSLAVNLFFRYCLSHNKSM